MDMPLYPGDPLTPGVGATPDAKRLAVTEAPTLTKIPVLPISYADARPLLEALGGQTAPEAWRGALPIDLSPRPRPGDRAPEARSSTSRRSRSTTSSRRSPARERPDQWVIRGNHHDALGQRRRPIPVERRSSRCWPRRTAVGDAGEVGLAAAQNDRLRGLGRRGSRPARLDRMGRDARRRVGSESRRLHQHATDTAAASSTQADRTRLEATGERGRARA